MARRKLVAGNWKMNGSRSALVQLDDIAAAATRHIGVDVAICPPATLIAAAVSRQPTLMIGAQDCHEALVGAHTGCISVAMIAEAGAQIIIVGHSERRTDQHEGNAEIREKAQAVIAAGLSAIVCVGESEAQRSAGQAIRSVEDQLAGSVPLGSNPAQLVIAYEPVWAIGTGRTPTVAEIAEMHRSIRAKLIGLIGSDGEDVRILYGGSVKASNAVELMTITNVDGALVGGASLIAADFIPIIAAAAQSVTPLATVNI